MTLRSRIIQYLGATVIAMTVLMGATVTPVMAGTDLTVACTAFSGCTIIPGSTPLFDESGILPGDSFEQVVTAQNNSAQSGVFAVESLNLANTDLGTGAQLSDAIYITVRQGSAVGPVVIGPVTLTEFINPDPEYYLLSSVGAGGTENYYFQAEFDVTAGNEYQALASVFDLRLGFEFIPSGSGSSGSGSSGSSGGGGGGSASAPVCTADAPSSAPLVTITGVGANTVSLSWTPVSPVTHYAVTFTRNSDGEQYGSPNIGNVTSYTVTNLSGGGASYTFRVFGVNDCAPGPFSGPAGTGPVLGGVITTRPTGPAGEVLGVTEPEPEVAGVDSETPAAGEVAGVSTCVTWRLYIPWILLIAQAVLVFINEYYFKNKREFTKHYITIGITLASILIFYLVRECSCYTGIWWLGWLCKWYWLVASVLSLLIRGFSYAFIEEIEPEKTAIPVTAEKPDTTSNTKQS